MEETWEERQERLRRLALLCLETRKLTDEELMEIDKADMELYSFLENRGSLAISGAARLLRYRSRQKELEKLSTEELEKMRRVHMAQRSSAMIADEYDELPDSFFEAPPIDSDEHIVYQLLEEREKTSM